VTQPGHPVIVDALGSRHSRLHPELPKGWCDKQTFHLLCAFPVVRVDLRGADAISD
jgi:hypothetical protein